MLSDDIKEARTIWPGVRNLIDYLLRCKMDYIIEGVHLLPSLAKRYKENKNVKIIFLSKFNENKIYKGLLNNKNNNDWITDNLKNKNIISAAAKSLCVYGAYFKRETKKNGLMLINREDDFNNSLNDIANNIV